MRRRYEHFCVAYLLTHFRGQLGQSLYRDILLMFHLLPQHLRLRPIITTYS